MSEEIPLELTLQMGRYVPFALFPRNPLTGVNLQADITERGGNSRYS